MNITVWTREISPQAQSDILADQRIIRYMEVTGFILLCYDYCLTFPDELEFVWNNQFSLITFLFFFQRLLALARNVVVLVSERLLTHYSNTQCLILRLFETWTNAAPVIIAEMIMTKRTAALWEKKGKIIWGCFALFFVSIVASMVYAEKTLQFVAEERISKSVNPYICYPTDSGNQFSIFYGVLVTYQTVLLCLTLYRLRQRKRIQGDANSSHSSLVRVLYRDSILYYAILLAVSIITIITMMAFSAGVGLALTTIHIDLHSILCSRLILNIRKTASPPPLSLHSSITFATPPVRTRESDL